MEILNGYNEGGSKLVVEFQNDNLGKNKAKPIPCT